MDSNPGPLCRLGTVKRDPLTPSIVFQRITDPRYRETLRDIADAWELPRGRFFEWFISEHATLYRSALKIRSNAWMRQFFVQHPWRDLPHVLLPDEMPRPFERKDGRYEYRAGIDYRGPYLFIRKSVVEDVI